MKLAAFLALARDACTVGSESADSDDGGDGVLDGLDLDCDGDIHIPFDFGDGGGGPNQCISTISTNGESKSVSCTDGTCKHQHAHRRGSVIGVLDPGQPLRLLMHRRGLDAPRAPMRVFRDARRRRLRRRTG